MVRRITRIAVHHTASPTRTTAAEVDRWHRARGWSGIGYHALIRETALGAWCVERGRPEDRAGAHVAGHNADSLGVAVAGDWSAGPPPTPALALLGVVCADWCRRYGLRPEAILGHGEHTGASTACPGQTPIPWLRARVAQLLELPSGDLETRLWSSLEPIELATLAAARAAAAARGGR